MHSLRLNKSTRAYRLPLSENPHLIRSRFMIKVSVAPGAGLGHATDHTQKVHRNAGGFGRLMSVIIGQRLSLVKGAVASAFTAPSDSSACAPPLAFGVCLPNDRTCHCPAAA